MNDINDIRANIHHLRVLYVEDEHELHDSVRLFLGKIFDRIDDAYDGKEGLVLFLSDSYDIVITDILMPLMKGSEMVQQMQQHAPNVFYAVLTGTNSEEPIDVTSNLILSKPMDMEAMLLLIEAIADHYKGKTC